MNYKEAIEYIHSNFWMGSKPGLSRTKDLLKRMGNPQNKLKFIHVAGTNGKGSFCAMMSSILIRAGLKVGTYTSPYILRFNERMQVNGRDIPDETLCELVEEIRPHVEAMEEKPTEFELITAIAMEFFRREKCNVVVLECGMGGRLDSTNVIKTPILSVITGIAKDHTAFLGDTLKKIAAEKAGIIKHGVPVLCCDENDEVRAVIEKKAKEKDAPLFFSDHKKLADEELSLQGTKFSYGDKKDLYIPLLGVFQPKNAANVLCSVELLKEAGLELSDEAIRVGLKESRWPARFELVRSKPIVLCDGAHNVEGVEAAVESAKRYFGEEKLHVVMGCMSDKEFRLMAERIVPLARDVFCLSPQSLRSLPSKELAEVFKELSLPAFAFKSTKAALAAALAAARQYGGAVICLGSLYMYEEIYHAINTLLPQ